MLPDRRSAFILPKYIYEDSFAVTNSRKAYLIRFLVLLGFIGMLRPHTFKQLSQRSFVVVTRAGTTIPLPTSRLQAQRLLYQLKHYNVILGFYVKFQSKTMRNAKAYFPTLCKKLPQLVSMCPVTTLLEVVAKGWMTGRLPFQSVATSKQIQAFLKGLCRTEVNIAPYALRIGGRT